jgi:N-methylhydantoinase A
MIPALPGALSAFGILVSDVVKDYSRTVLWRVALKLPAKQIDKEFAALQHRAETDFRDEDWSGKITYQRSVDARYQGQGYELNIPYTRNLIADFRHEHQQRYGHSYPDRDVELVTLRLRSIIKASQARMSTITTNRVGTAAPSRPGRAKLGGALNRAPVIFAGKKLTAAIQSRDSLQPGNKYSGPAVITEYSATMVVPPGKRFWLDKWGNLLIATDLS